MPHLSTARRKALDAFVVLPLTLLLPACAMRAADMAASAPRDWSLSLYRATADKQFTLFELSPGGALSFGGGLKAQGRGAASLATLSTEQRQRLWDIIREHRLLDAPHRPFDTSTRVQYDLAVRFGASGRRVRTIDDQAPGMEALHDELMSVVKQTKYGVPYFGEQ